MKTKHIIITGLFAALLPLSASGAAKVDILYAYTPNVASTFGGTTNTRALIAARHSSARDTFTNSTTDVDLNRVGYFQTTYNTKHTPGTQLSRLESSSKLRDVRFQRIMKRADLVQLYCEYSTTDTWGIAYQPGWSSTIYSATLAYPTYTSGARHAAFLSPAHEIGHNFGADHSEGAFSSAKDSSGDSLHRTVMSLNSDSRSTSWNRREIFSGPTMSWSGHSLGDSSHNNRDRVRARRYTTSFYMF